MPVIETEQRTVERVVAGWVDQLCSDEVQAHLCVALRYGRVAQLVLYMDRKGIIGKVKVSTS